MGFFENSRESNVSIRAKWLSTSQIGLCSVELVYMKVKLYLSIFSKTAHLTTIYQSKIYI